MALFDSNRWRIQDESLTSRTIQQDEENPWTLQSYTTTLGGQRFEGSFSTVPLKHAEVMACLAWLEDNRRFDVRLPLFSRNAASPSGTPRLKQPAAAGNTVIYLKNGPANTPNYLPAAHRLITASHAKVYTVAEDVSTDALGECTVRLIHALNKDVAQDTGFTLQDIPLHVIRTSRVLQYKVSARDGTLRTRLEVNFREYF